MIDRNHTKLSISRQCSLLGLSRSSLYYKPRATSGNDIDLMHAVDEEFMKAPFYGSRKLAKHLSQRFSVRINRKRIQRLMREMGIEAIYPKPNTSRPEKEHEKYPYLLRNLHITGPNQVWSSDITYVRLEGGFAYLVAIIDWYSRKVISWRLSNTLDSNFCIEALNEALETGKPTIFNTDQGCQFTSKAFTTVLKANEIKVSMDGKG